MKTFIGALALIIAAPGVAQTAPATDPHAGHAQHQGTDHSTAKAIMTARNAARR